MQTVEVATQCRNILMSFMLCPHRCGRRKRRSMVLLSISPCHSHQARRKICCQVRQVTITNGVFRIMGPDWNNLGFIWTYNWDQGKGKDCAKHDHYNHNWCDAGLYYMLFWHNTFWRKARPKILFHNLLLRFVLIGWVGDWERDKGPFSISLASIFRPSESCRA